MAAACLHICKWNFCSINPVTDVTCDDVPDTPSLIEERSHVSLPSHCRPRLEFHGPICLSTCRTGRLWLAYFTREDQRPDGRRPRPAVARRLGAGDTNPQSDPDLEAGLRTLQGPQRSSAEAARHLWQSVKNQNASALIPLAGLYAKGDGVSKDCDQAKILLDPATRQAKSHTEFLRMEMIRADLRTSGCE